MIRVIATFNCDPKNTQKAIEHAKELVMETRKEKGCVQYDLLQSEGDEAKIVILECWNTQEDLNAHSASEHFGRLVPQLAGLCTTPPAVENYIALC